MPAIVLQFYVSSIPCFLGRFTKRSSATKWRCMKSAEQATTKVCPWCSSKFIVTASDAAFYTRVSVPSPTLCNECRQQQRTLHVNQLHLFRRTCAGTGKQILCSYTPESPFKICAQPYWYSDEVENTVHGRSFDFNRRFFEQYRELQLAALRPALFTDFSRDENSEYTNFAGKNKNCYLIFDSDENWDCYYGYSMNGGRSSQDCYRVEKCELCYEIIDSRNCYNCAFVSNSENCWDSAYLNNCIGCKNCFMCSNLQQKAHYILNKPATKEQVTALRQGLASFRTATETKQRFSAFAAAFPQKFLRGFQNENVQGNYLTNSRNASHCFDCRDVWDVRYTYQAFMPLKDCMDIDECGEAELLYECSNVGYTAFNTQFSLMSLNQLSNLAYCELCFNGCSDLFGCIGLKKKKHCILNKQYSKDEYQALRVRVIRHMTETGEWGEFFPPELSTTPYNLSKAQEFFPLTKQQAEARGFYWRDEDRGEYQAATCALPDSVYETPPEIIKELLLCTSCKKNYKIIAKELQFYQTAGLALPRKCFLCRHNDRRASRTPRKLWPRNCDKCAADFECAHTPGGKEVVYCESCYLDSLC